MTRDVGPRPLRVLMVAAEYAPLAQVGGLGDAVAGLAGALARRGHAVRVALPRYGSLDPADLPAAGEDRRLPVRLGTTVHAVTVRPRRHGAVTLRLLDAPDLFGRTGIYGYAEREEFPDTPARLGCHAQAALLDALADDWIPDVLHVHDAAAALALVVLRSWHDPAGTLDRTAGVLTIHNLVHQAVQPVSALTVWDLPASLGPPDGPLAFHGRLNPMRGGILLADRVVTVSSTYAREVLADPELGAGLAGDLASRGEDFTGIRNGIDTGAWDPARDPALPAPFSAGEPAARRESAALLCRELALADGEGPLLGLVGRLDRQKGFDLPLPVLASWVSAGARVVLLGTGDPAIAAAWHEAALAHAGRVAFAERFDDRLARLIYAGSDLLLVPSRFEPCGLVQMYAMRYGSVPVARRTGGLADTVVDADADPGTGNGFLFAEPQPADLDAAVRRAWRAWRQPERWRAIQGRGMHRDWSWDGPATAYADLFAKAVADRNPRNGAGGPGRGGS